MVNVCRLLFLNLTLHHSKPMHILVFSPVYPPYKGGMGAVAAQEVRLIQEAGHTVRVLTPGYSDKALSVEEHVTCIDPLYAWGNGAILPWRKIWREIKAHDVVHLHYPFFGTALPVACMVRLAKKRLVVTWHMRAQAERRAIVRGALFFLHRLFEEPLIKRFAHAICVSSSDYATLLNLPAEKVIPVPFGVDDRRFVQKRNTALRVSKNMHEDTCVFLFVGGMDRAHAFKGVSLLLHAFVKVPQTIDARLWLVGDGDLRAVYEVLAQELGITNRIAFLGSVPFQDLPGVYQAADVHVLSSVNGAEAYGLVTCEAGASGIPSIVSALPGVRSLVVHEETGLHVNPGDILSLSEALLRLATNKEERRQFGSAAYKKITKNFTLQAEQAQLLRAYTERGTVI